MLVLIVIAAVVIVVVVVFLAMGRGGELSAERPDYLPIDVGPVSATDVALLRPPTGLWGYNMQATDEAMELIAESIRERDVRIVALEQLVTDLNRGHASPQQLLGSPYSWARYRRTATAASEAAGPAIQDAAPHFPHPTPMAEPAEPGGFPFEATQPTGDVTSAAPEESHD